MKTPRQIRWNIEVAAREFGINPRTLSANLVKADQQPGEDGMFSTPQVCSAVFSDYEQENTRLRKAQADQAELDLSVARKEVVPVEIAFQTVSNMLFSVRRVIETSDLPTENKDEIYEQLQGLKPDDFISEAKFEEGQE
jgi:hypothetical protein